MDETVRRSLAGARRVVVKVGTAVVSGPQGQLALGRIGHLMEDLRALSQDGREVLLVSSGAVGLGAGRLGWTAPPKRVVDRQACAAIGQVALMSLYDAMLGQLGRRAAQVLLTQDDFLQRQRYLNVQATLERLLALGVLPIINENDTVSTAELAVGRDEVFGDNDRLSALVSAGLGADLLVLLTSVDGVYTAPPASPGAKRISRYAPDETIHFGEGSAWGRGGMQAKLAATQVAIQCGTPVVIASGMAGGVLQRVIAGEDVGTIFPARRQHNRRRQWLAFATAPAGRLMVNDGARRALTERNASLLAIGVQDVLGSFDAGAVVSVCTADGSEFARGWSDQSANEIQERIASPGDGRSRPIIHRDRIVILSTEGS
ncbi:MAG: glutamate 5-kinase [Myxococcota bacterium]